MNSLAMTAREAAALVVSNQPSEHNTAVAQVWALIAIADAIALWARVALPDEVPDLPRYEPDGTPA